MPRRRGSPSRCGLTEGSSANLRSVSRSTASTRFGSSAMSIGMRTVGWDQLRERFVTTLISPLGMKWSAPSPSRNSVWWKDITSTFPATPAARTTSPTANWLSMMIRTPPSQSRTRVCAPSPAAMPNPPAAASAGVTSKPSSRTAMSEVTITITIQEARRSIFPRVAARVSRSPANPSVPDRMAVSIRHTRIRAILHMRNAETMMSPTRIAAVASVVAGVPAGFMFIESPDHFERRGVHDGPHQILVAHSRGGRGLRDQARLGHAGNGVHLEAEGSSLLIEAEVHARDAARADRAAGPYAELHQPLRGLGRELGGTLVAARARRVLVLVIVEAPLGDDLHHGKRAVVEHRDRDLAALDEALDERQPAVAPRGLEGAPELRARVGDGDAHRGSLIVGLHDQGKSAEALDLLVLELGIPGLRRILGGPALDPLRSGNPLVHEDPLGDRLVHRQRGGEHAGAGVGNARQVEHRLQRPVLAVPAVERHEDELHVARHAADERLQAGVLRALRDRRRRERRGPGRTSQRRAKLPRAQKRSGSRIERDHLVPECQQRLAHAGSRADRDLPLLARASHQDRDLHGSSTSTRATAIAAIPSLRPMEPRPSLEVALTETHSGVTPRAPASRSLISATWG